MLFLIYHKSKSIYSIETTTIRAYTPNLACFCCKCFAFSDEWWKCSVFFSVFLFIHSTYWRSVILLLVIHRKIVYESVIRSLWNSWNWLVYANEWWLQWLNCLVADFEKNERIPKRWMYFPPHRFSLSLIFFHRKDYKSFIIEFVDNFSSDLKVVCIRVRSKNIF